MAESAKLLSFNDGSNDSLLVKIEKKMHLRRAIEATRRLSCCQLFTILVLTLMVIVGNGGQVITLNMWLKNFKEHGLARPFTVLTLSALINASAFGVAVILRLIFYRPNMRFLASLKGFVLTVAVGFCNSTNGVLLVFATGDTPEIIQALLLSTMIFWTLIFSVFVLREGRSYLTASVVLAFLFSAGGIILGASSQFKSAVMTYDKKMWTLIFAASIVPGALYNVLASLYMRSFTLTPKDLDEGEEPGSPMSDSGYPTGKSDDTTVKLTMLCTTGFSQVFWMFVYFPLDSAPWFGTSNTASESRHALAEGWKCVFDNDKCSDNWIYFLLFNGCYFLNYVGAAYLNHYSAGLCSMVTQLSAPFAALTLIIIPSWNVDTTDYEVGPAVGGALLILVGSLIYSSWEQGSRESAKEEEKAALLGTDTQNPHAPPGMSMPMMVGDMPSSQPHGW